MESGQLPRAAERATDAARRARQLDAALARLRAGGALTAEDLRFAWQARDRARGRLAGAQRDARKARDSAQVRYEAAKVTSEDASRLEETAAALLASAGRPDRAAFHMRRADEYQALAAECAAASASMRPDDEGPGRSRPLDQAAGVGRLTSTSRQADSSSPPPTGRDPRLDPAHRLVISDINDLRGLRRKLGTLLETCGVSNSAVEELVLATEEVAVNGLRHGVPPVHVEIGKATGGVFCAVTDQGTGFDWASATDRATDPDSIAEGRFGLRIAQELCDELVTLHTPEGFTVRLLKHDGTPRSQLTPQRF